MRVSVDSVVPVVHQTNVNSELILMFLQPLHVSNNDILYIETLVVRYVFLKRAKVEKQTAPSLHPLCEQRGQRR